MPNELEKAQNNPDFSEWSNWINDTLSDHGLSQSTQIINNEFLTVTVSNSDTQIISAGCLLKELRTRRFNDQPLTNGKDNVPIKIVFGKIAIPVTVLYDRNKSEWDNNLNREQRAFIKAFLETQFEALIDSDFDNCRKKFESLYNFLNPSSS